MALLSVAGVVAAGEVEVAQAARSRQRRGPGAWAGTVQARSAGKPSPQGPVTQTSPLKTKTVDRLLSSRDGHITAAVEDLRTGQEWLLNRGDRDQTASIVKADILETLMHQRGRTSPGLDSLENETAAGMIEESDNEDATDLWDEAGEAAGVAAYDRLVGMGSTTPSAYWGETLTTAADQIKLLEQLACPNGLLTTADRNYELHLMRHVAGYEDWGVNGGVPSNVSVALKNGWVPIDSDGDAVDGDDDDDGGWEVNSIGWVKGDGRDYLIAVLTVHDPTEEYGIDSIDALSGDVYRALKPVSTGARAKSG